ncbi:TSUP family transporter [Pseudoponticoccus marisrubri]|uniref:Probable membrane transporter protein n=1 Tax=Pseudoponticoccus marisrubri TaxID=1685382 RepID=A0A0W7WLL0_9RHOB|nr:TSUP family transporter [Pseudoponticoccus marisrubri]KUF11491.1 hypothetical protein AVJ23_06925 [Pseudoponticoccus marisrubri]
MPDLVGPAPEGLGWLILAAFAGGLVRGFSGFGTALIFLPVAGQILPPFQAILVLTFMDALGPLPNLRPAWTVAARDDLKRLCLGTVLLLPVGLALLALAPPGAFRILVSVLAFAMLAALAGGLRYRGTVTRAMVTGIGAAAGVLGGIAGLPGPAVILFYMARPLPAATIRATILLFLFGFDLLLMGWMGVMGHMDASMALLGLGLGVPCLLGNRLGAHLFDPARERAYRGVAYGLIALSALSGLPVWG